MRVLMTAAALSLVFSAAAPAQDEKDGKKDVAKKGDAKEELSKAGEKTSKANSYAFKFEGSGGGGEKAAGKGMNLDGAWSKDDGLVGKANGVSFVKKGDKIAYQDKKGGWHKAGESGDEGGKGAKGDPSRLLKQLKLPHEDVADIAGKFKAIEKTNDDASKCDVFSGDLTDEAARQYGRLGGGGKKAGGGKDSPIKSTGTIKVTVNADGTVEKIEIKVKLSGTLGDRTIDAEITRTTTLSDFDKAKVDVPEDAKKLLEG